MIDLDGEVDDALVVDVEYVDVVAAGVVVGDDVDVVAVGDGDG